MWAASMISFTLLPRNLLERVLFSSHEDNIVLVNYMLSQLELVIWHDRKLDMLWLWCDRKLELSCLWYDTILNRTCLNCKNGNWYTVRLLSWAWYHTMNTVKSIYVEDIDSRDGLFQHRNYFIGLRIVRERHRRRHAARRYDITIQGSSVFKRYRQYDVIHRHKTISSFDGFLLSEHSGWTLPDYPKKPSTLSFSRIDTASYIKLVHSCPCAALLASYITPT